VKKTLVFLAVFCLGLQAKALEMPDKIEGLEFATKRTISIPLKDKKTKIFIFLSSRCPCSRSHETIISDLAREFGEFPFYAINSNMDEDFEKSKEYFLKLNLPLVVLRDDKAHIADLFGALKTPHAFIVNGEGIIVYSGGVSDSAHAATAKKPYLEIALQSVRSGKLPDPKEARALGCVISRSAK